MEQTLFSRLYNGVDRFCLSLSRKPNWQNKLIEGERQDLPFFWGAAEFSCSPHRLSSIRKLSSISQVTTRFNFILIRLQYLFRFIYTDTPRIKWKFPNNIAKYKSKFTLKNIMKATPRKLRKAHINLANNIIYALVMIELPLPFFLPLPNLNYWKGKGSTPS